METRSFFTAGDGCKIAYRFDGPADKPVLLLSNSIATTLEMWDAQIAGLSRHFRVLRYDMRGHGQSGAPLGAYSLDRLGRDVVELLDGLDIAQVHFCGLSLGGMVGQWLGIHAANRLDRLILCNTSAYLGPGDSFDTMIHSLARSDDMTAMAEMFMTNWFPPAMHAGQPELIQRFRDGVLATLPHGLAGNFAAVRDMDLRRTITLIERPTLVIAGQYDTVTLASHSEQIAAAIPGSRLLVLPAVHLSNVEFPAAFLDAVVTFLQPGS
ncbi:3-oxoadipate enol-lactonase [Andreprevotia lacus DSM 23236]|jgi:3-oxoadipate enol-lactonase|uniref:3-oxoadipate enol-lactonase n=1 Tax=Andreprevotia lacus DSM 23236 TaxID=1121001 RepID=A0A1W1XNB0_9NEIS|nr:alpha/beta fold hydrolase [Andreprevotia lacus]SMC25364.1 3-oxoadipate enol-lactonase [Andreprevotia lacus DSM 23236]